MTPLQALRAFLEKDSNLRSVSSQAGFAKLVGRSEPLVRSIEKRRVKMSRKLARQIRLILGVDEDWLMSDTSDGVKIPSSSGRDITHLDVVHAITSAGIAPQLVNVKLPSVPLDFAKRQMVEAIVSMVHAEFIDFCENPKGDASDPFTEILDWLHKRAEKRSLFPTTRSQVSTS